MQRSTAFFELCVLPAKTEKNQENFPGHSTFCNLLLELVNKKLRTDLPLIIEDDIHLSHMIDEILLFSKEITTISMVDVPSSSLPLNVLLSSGESQLFSRWIDLERKFAFEKVDEMMLRDSSWTSCEREGYYHVSKCAEIFVALLQSITNRFKLLDNVKLQLKVCLSTMRSH